MTKKVTPRAKNTQVRITSVSAGMIQRLSKQLFKQYEAAHVRMGLNKPSSRLAIDYMIYQVSKAGIGAWTELTEKNNLYMMMLDNLVEEQNNVVD